MAILLFFFVIPIAAWVINLFVVCHVIEKNCKGTKENLPPTVGQTLVKYIVLTAIIFAIYSVPLLLLGPTYGSRVLHIAMMEKLGPSTPVWICAALAIVFFIWEIYRKKSMPFAHLGSGADEIGYAALAISVVVWTATLFIVVGYIFSHLIWNNVYYW
ncbi:hypothetical protein [Rahnella victoriana]|uniref:Uncharacterized protein n=1 Tax=Rahnella victoriana TaxID=1510570 RepID=A0ABS0DVS1_9GAMM|nr:hypothetical protein [Rahnella victoriana]MBF7957966.1 hypothetical protein [Rahnella victoriana]